MLVLGGGVDGALGVARAADGRRHTLGGDEGPVAAAVGGELQPHAVGEGRGLAAAHADLKLQEGGAGHLEVPALRVPGLFCRGEVGQGGVGGRQGRGTLFKLPLGFCYTSVSGGQSVVATLVPSTLLLVTILGRNTCRVDETESKIVH